MAKIYLTGDYSEDGGTYALQIIADLLISKGHKVTFPAQYRVSCTQKEEESNTSWASKAFINNLHTITNSNCVLAIYSGLISNSNIGYECLKQIERFEIDQLCENKPKFDFTYLENDIILATIDGESVDEIVKNALTKYRK